MIILIYFISKIPRREIDTPIQCIFNVIRYSVYRSLAVVNVLYYRFYTATGIAITNEF